MTKIDFTDQRVRPFLPNWFPFDEIHVQDLYKKAKSPGGFDYKGLKFDSYGVYKDKLSVYTDYNSDMLSKFKTLTLKIELNRKCNTFVKCHFSGTFSEHSKLSVIVSNKHNMFEQKFITTFDMKNGSLLLCNLYGGLPDVSQKMKRSIACLNPMMKK